MVVIFMILGGNTVIIAQNGPPNPPDGSDNNQNNKLGAVPISGGVLILLGLGLAYGGRKLKDKEEE